MTTDLVPEIVKLLIAFITGLVGPVGVIVAKARIEKGATATATEPTRRRGETTADPQALSSVVLRWATQLSEDVQRMHGRLAELENEIEGLKKENAKLRRHAEILSGQVVDLGGKPWPMPE